MPAPKACRSCRLAFQSAREEAVLIQEGSPAPVATAQQNADQQNIAKAQADIDSRIGETQSRIERLNRQIRVSGGKKRKELIDQRDTLQGELDLDETLKEGLSKISAFMSSSENTGLMGKINGLMTSVPELAPTTRQAARQPGTQAPKSGRAYASGLIGETAVLLSQIGDVRAIDGLLSETASLRGTAQGVQRPLRDALRGLLKEGRDAVNQPESGPGGARETLEGITARFKQVSSAALPLRQEMILLDQTRANLIEWRKSVEREYLAVLRSLLTHVTIMIVALFLVMALLRGLAPGHVQVCS